MNDLRELLSTRETRDPATLLIAIREGLGTDPAASGPAADLHALLLGFFAIEDIAASSTHREAFKRHPEAAHRLLAMLEEDGAGQVAKLVRSLLGDIPEPLGALKDGLLGPGAAEAAKHGAGLQAAFETFTREALGSPATTAELELSLGWEAVEDGLLDRIQAQAGELAFTHGESHRKAVGRSQELDALVARMDIVSMLDALATAQNPGIMAQASTWDIQHQGASPHLHEVPVCHRLCKQQPGPALRLAGSPAAVQLQALYSFTNGGELFVPVSNPREEPGLRLIPDTDWETEREYVMTWLTMGQDEGGELPAWAHSLVPIAMLPGDASRWVTPLEGPCAGAVMLSNDDVRDEHVRYKSIAHFIAALRLVPHEVLANGGYVSYMGADERHLLYPVGYRERA